MPKLVSRSKICYARRPEIRRMLVGSPHSELAKGRAGWSGFSFRTPSRKERTFFVSLSATTNFNPENKTKSSNRTPISRYISLRERPNQPNSRVYHLHFNRSNQRRPRFDLSLQMNSKHGGLRRREFSPSDSGSFPSSPRANPRLRLGKPGTRYTPVPTTRFEVSKTGRDRVVPAYHFILSGSNLPA
jgi:hypothetical protein